LQSDTDRKLTVVDLQALDLLNPNQTIPKHVQKFNHKSGFPEPLIINYSV